MPSTIVSNLDEIAPRERVRAEHLDLRAELLDRGRHLIAGAHHVADGQVRRRLDVDHLQRHGRRVVDVLPADVRILDHLVAAIEALPARRRVRRQTELRRLPRSAPAAPGTAPSAIRPGA